jgi:hypothetical protein
VIRPQIELRPDDLAHGVALELPTAMSRYVMAVP